MGVGVFVNTIDPHFSEASQVTMWQSTVKTPPSLCNQRVYTAVNENDVVDWHADVYLDSGEEMKGVAIDRHPYDVSCLWYIQGKILTGSEQADPSHSSTP